MAPAGSSSFDPFVSMPSYLYDTFSTSHHDPVPFLPSSSASTISKNFFLGTKPGLDFTHINKVTANVSLTDSTTSSLLGKKKYKPVAQKIRAVAADLPDKFRIERNIIGNPLAEMPSLPTNPPSFTPTGRYTTERRDIIDRAHDDDFLWPQERDLMHHFMSEQNEGFAWDDSERGTFREDFFPPVRMPVIEHKPWVLRNRPIPPGIYDDVCKVIRTKIEAGVYEPSNSSYRSRWFCVLKKNKGLRLIHSLEPLNAVTILHSGVPPHTEHVAEHFASRACGGILDLYVGYDERILHKDSRDYTTFQTPYGAHRLVTLPMGWSNSVPIFHEDVTHILQPKIPNTTIPYIDDVPIRGPASRYVLDDGSYETIPENPGIRRFVWEHFQGLNRVVQRMKYCGGTFSGHKATLCAEEITVVGHRCTYDGRIPDTSQVAKIRNWGPCANLSDVRAFLGTIGVLRVFIQNFAKRANPLTALTRKDAPFEWGPAQAAAQEDLKNALLTCPALKPLDYVSGAPVVLAVDTSAVAIGYFLCQCDPENPKKRTYARFGSITLNEREARFSQPKLELYGLFRTLRALKHYLIGIRNLIVEVDARYIKGMLNNPDIDPSATINRWILSILTFHFTLVHVPGTMHGPDGLSRRRAQPGDDPEPKDDFDDWVDQLYGFVHLVNPPLRTAQRSTATPVYSTFVASPTLRLDYNEIEYSEVPRSPSATRADLRLTLLVPWLTSLERPPELSDSEYKHFVRFGTQFFYGHGKLWRRQTDGHHKLVAFPDIRIKILRATHDEVAHKGYFATSSHIVKRFWWPDMLSDIAWFVKTCLLCQLRQTKQILIPPTVPLPAPLFAKMHMDTMHLPASGGFKYIVQGRCTLSHWPEFRCLRAETAHTLSEWIYQDVLCRWGTLSEIVTDNGPAFVKACEQLSKKYHVNHIRISGYNSRANGLVERPHFDVRQALFKAALGDQSRWSQSAYSVFWADRITTRRRMGCSPYFATTGTHPILPIDIVEASYLLPPPDAPLSSTELIANRALTLQKRHDQVAKLHSKVYAARVQAAIRFEQEHANIVKDFNFQPGDLVLARNTAIEKALNRKMRARYLGPLVVISRNRGKAYILAELDGSVLDRPVAAFRLLPFFARKAIPIADLHSFIDVSQTRLTEMEASYGQGDDDYEAPLDFDRDNDDDIDESFPNPD